MDGGAAGGAAFSVGSLGDAENRETSRRLGRQLEERSRLSGRSRPSRISVDDSAQRDFVDDYPEIAECCYRLLVP